MGLRLLKIGVSWPLEPECICEFAEGLDEILVVEEKRQIIEYQIKEHLYNASISARPRVVGKYDETGENGCTCRTTASCCRPTAN